MGLTHAAAQESKGQVRFIVPLIFMPAFFASFAYLSFWPGLLAAAASAVVGLLLMTFVMPIARLERTAGMSAGVYPASYLLVALTHLWDRELWHGAWPPA